MSVNEQNGQVGGVRQSNFRFSAKELLILFMLIAIGILLLFGSLVTIADSLAIVSAYYPIISLVWIVTLAGLGTKCIRSIFSQRKAPLPWQALIVWIMLAAATSTTLTYLWQVSIPAHWTNALAVEQTKIAAPYVVQSSTYNVTVDGDTYAGTFVHEQLFTPKVKMSEFVERDLYDYGTICGGTIRMSIHAVENGWVTHEIPTSVQIRKMPPTSLSDTANWYFAHVVIDPAGLTPGTQYLRKTKMVMHNAYRDEANTAFAVRTKANVDTIRININFAGFCAIDPGYTTVTFGNDEGEENLNEAIRMSVATGKTSAIQVLHHDLKQRDVIVVYWNYFIWPGQGGVWLQSVKCTPLREGTL